MIFRLVSIVIVAFWLVMMALLIKVKIWPDDSLVLRVPVEHVMKVVFLHGLNSDLDILDNKERIGNLSFRPREIEAGSPRRLDFTGNLLVKMPTMERQSVRWSGSVQVNAALDLQNLALQLEWRKPPMALSLQTGADRLLRYEVTQPGFPMEKGALALDKPLPPEWAESFGLNGSAFGPLAHGMQVPTVTAQQNRIHLRQEEVDVYQIDVRQGETVLATLYVSQLGQILMARTIFGYTLQADDIAP